MFLAQFFETIFSEVRDMYEKVEHLMKQKGVTPYRVAKDLGFSTGL